eukprot:69298-Pyramimonas_sp.AAC.1
MGGSHELPPRGGPQQPGLPARAPRHLPRGLPERHLDPRCLPSAASEGWEVRRRRPSQRAAELLRSPRAF